MRFCRDWTGIEEPLNLGMLTESAAWPSDQSILKAYERLAQVFTRTQMHIVSSTVPPRLRPWTR